jgi:hypothetical protein
VTCGFVNACGSSPVVDWFVPESIGGCVTSELSLESILAIAKVESPTVGADQVGSLNVRAMQKTRLPKISKGGFWNLCLNNQ